VVFLASLGSYLAAFMLLRCCVTILLAALRSVHLCGASSGQWLVAFAAHRRHLMNDGAFRWVPAVTGLLSNLLLET
jgi:hypothetical protein